MTRYGSFSLSCGRGTTLRAFIRAAKDAGRRAVVRIAGFDGQTQHVHVYVCVVGEEASLLVAAGEASNAVILPDEGMVQRCTIPTISAPGSEPWAVTDATTRGRFGAAVEGRLREWFGRTRLLGDDQFWLLNTWPRWVGASARSGSRLRATGVAIDFTFASCPRVAPSEVQLTGALRLKLHWSFGPAVRYVGWEWAPGMRELSPADLRHKMHGRVQHAPAAQTQMAKKQQEWVAKGHAELNEQGLFTAAVNLWQTPDGRFCGMDTFHAVRYNTLKRTCGPSCKMGLPPCILAHDATPLPAGGTVDQLFLALPQYAGSAREQQAAKRDGKRTAPLPISGRPGFGGGTPKAKLTAKEARLEKAHGADDDDDDAPDVSARVVEGEGSGSGDRGDADADVH
jgi:hypothetical protein